MAFVVKRKHMKNKTSPQKQPDYLIYNKTTPAKRVKNRHIICQLKEFQYFCSSHLKETNKNFILV